MIKRCGSSNDTGVHVSNVFAKIVERAIASMLVPHFFRAALLNVISWDFATSTLIEIWSQFLCAGGFGV